MGELPWELPMVKPLEVVLEVVGPMLSQLDKVPALVDSEAETEWEKVLEKQLETPTEMDLPMDMPRCTGSKKPMLLLLHLSLLKSCFVNCFCFVPLALVNAIFSGGYSITNIHLLSLVAI